MPATYHIYPEARLVYTCAVGRLAGREMIAHATALAADPAFSPDFAQLADFQKTTVFAATAADMRLLADHNPFDRAARRVALVRTPIAFGMLRMYQLLCDIEESASLVTRSRRQAWAFLGRTPDVLRGAVASAWTSDDAPARR
ncbi:hypothetical protein [Roseisolibacter agri]|uniref:Uncharacterized protein n=1 Tax=Roseisolibacter agri TaxID=2014610 RepID=A0AA37PZ42_9BACT|nr:hypothetical protein [Roseisolibacter agri]GLC23585.1 hypothetical protein rosag_00980 [Roseisolibacter agri]